jgi:hypothetical protein
MARSSRPSQETLLAQQSIKLLRGAGFCCIRLQSGSRKAVDGWIHGAPKGTPDWFVVCPFILLEFKDLSEPSKEQLAWHAWARRCGIPVAVPRTPAQAFQAVMTEQRKLAYWERFVIEEKKP